MKLYKSLVWFVYKIPYRRARAWPSAWPSASREQRLYARYLCSRDALGLKAEAVRPSAARDDRVYCIQEQRYLAYNCVVF